MRVFPDTNVLVSAIVARGLCEDLLRLLVRGHVHGRWELLVGAPVEDELKRILRTKLGAHRGPLTIAHELLAEGRRVSRRVSHLTATTPDPSDVPILACALAARADYFVTGNRALLDLEEVHNMRLLSPR